MGNVYLSESSATLKTASAVDKAKEYYHYIDEHIMNVKEAFGRLKNKYQTQGIRHNKFFSEEDFVNALEYLEREKIGTHDASKYSDDEFQAYRRYFYPTDEEKNSSTEEERMISEEEFKDAWHHHYTHNDHHPNFWVDNSGRPINMELQAIIHMLCDWEAMSIKFNGNTVEWYKKAEEEKSYMTNTTKEIVEFLLGEFFQ